MDINQHAFNAHVQPPVWDWIAYRAERAAELDASKPDIVVGVQAAYTTDFLVQTLEAKLLRYGRRPRVFAGGFNQFRQELLDPTGAHYAAKPHATVLLLDPRASTGPAALNEIEKIAETHASALPDGLLVVSNLFASGQPAHDVHSFNAGLRALASREPGLRILDMDAWITKWGWQRVVDPKHEFLAGMLVAPEMVPYLAEEILAFVYERIGLRKKCLVLDLDETLWGGIVGEDGLSGIALDVQPPGNVYRAIQETAAALRQKGVLLAVASKNNPTDALEVIDKHPHMILRRDHFADMQIGWQPKDEMLRAIAKNLNIGVDSLVFLDDNPNERELVRSLLPGVTVLDPPADPAWWPRYLQGLRCFEASTLTEEDKKRAQMYEEEKKRKALQASAGTLEDYLRTLETKVMIGRLMSKDDENLPRVAQLSQRTNQFNLNPAQRYSEQNLSGMLEQTKAQEKYPIPKNILHRVFWMKVSDRLGDSGLVAAAVVSVECGRPSEAVILNFFMSCRVIGRQVERAFIQEILKHLKEVNNPDKVYAHYNASEKNMLTRDFYNKTVGFKSIYEDQRHTAIKFMLSLEEYNPEPVPHIEISNLLT